jgi:hypothetical protein
MPVRPLPTAVLSTLIVAALGATAGGVALADDGPGPHDTGPHDTGPRHVTQISGSREHGFHVVWSDGYAWWTPAMSEDLSLCQEYDRPARRGRCRGSTRSKYAWMGILKRSLRHEGR